jgi:hypothetical protein
MSIKDSLDKLGDTKEKIRSSLLGMGIKGYKARTRMCPVAKYLRNEGFPNAEVCGDHVCNEDDFTPTCLIAMSPIMVAFINAFDHGNYPELESK